MAFWLKVAFVKVVDGWMYCRRVMVETGQKFLPGPRLNFPSLVPCKSMSLVPCWSSSLVLC